MNLFRRYFRPPPTAAELTAPLVRQLDQYHNLWAAFNRSLEPRLERLEAGLKDTALLESRLQALEQDRNKLRIDVEDALEQTAKLYNRLRMRHSRELDLEPQPPADDGSIALLKRKGMG